MTIRHPRWTFRKQPKKRVKRKRTSYWRKGWHKEKGQ